VNEADQNLVAVLQSMLPDKLIILLPSPEASEVTLFYSDLQAVIDCDSSPPTFLVQSLRTSSIVECGQEATVIEAILSAYTVMRSRAGDGRDHPKAA
jgi:hypothetical protein